MVLLHDELTYTNERFTAPFGGLTSSCVAKGLVIIGKIKLITTEQSKSLFLS